MCCKTLLRCIGCAPCVTLAILLFCVTPVAVMLVLAAIVEYREVHGGL